MGSALPPNFVDLNTASSRINSEVSIMGVVTDFLPPGRSKGTDWMCSFSIMDSSFDCYNQPYVEGLKIRFFRPTENEMPSIRGTGDVILIRFLKIKQWSGLTMGISNRGTSWTVFPVGSIPAEVSGSQIQLKHIKEPRAQVPSVSEMRYAVGLCHSRDGIMPTQPTSTPMQSSSATFPIGSAPSNLVRKDKYALIKDIASDTYYDLVGQVVRTYPHSDRIELYFTDYTSNSLLFNYEWGQDDEDCSGREGDIYGYVPRVSTNKKWPGPYGRMTMTVTLWPPHAHFVRDNVKDNDYVYLRNVHIKFSKDCKLEGVLHTDQRCPDRINVTAVNNNSDDDRVKDVLRRKRDYSKKFQKSTKEFVAEVRGSKRKNLDEVKPLSRTAQRKKRKQEREQLAKAKYRDDGGSDKENPVGMSTKDQPSDNKSVLSCQKQDLNRNVNCSNHLITPRSLSSIFSNDKNANTTPEGTSYLLPFQNIKSRATVHVTDFFPSDLADFAVPCPKPSEFDVLSDPGDSQDESGADTLSIDAGSETESERRWEWRFGLKLQDAMGHRKEEVATMDVFIAGQDAECLLKLDAVDLRESPKALATLREKLFLLWGDLEERKSRASTTLKQIDGNAESPQKGEAPKSKPFHCCLKEYGVKKRMQRNVEIGDRERDDGCDDEGEDWVWERRWKMFGTTII